MKFEVDWEIGEECWMVTKDRTKVIHCKVQGIEAWQIDKGTMLYRLYTSYREKPGDVQHMAESKFCFKTEDDAYSSVRSLMVTIEA